MAKKDEFMHFKGSMNIPMKKAKGSDINDVAADMNKRLSSSKKRSKK